MSEFANTNLSNNELCVKLATVVVSNLNELLDTVDINVELDFENASKLLDNLLLHIYVIKDKTSDSYEKSKKNFSKLLSCNYKLIKEKFNLSEIITDKEQQSDFFELFEDGPNKHWIKFLFIIVSYLSFTKQSNKDPNINYSGMIDKLSNKIEEYNDLENSDSSELCDESDNDNEDTNELFTLNDNAQNLLNQLRENVPSSTLESTNVMKSLLGDIKGMLSSGNNIETQNILDFSKNLSDKYQNMIEKGEVNIADIFTGVIDLLNDPNAIGDEFDDINTDNLPNPNDLIQQMSSDSTLKEAMSMIGNMGLNGSGINGGMLDAMISGLMGNQNDPNAPQTIHGLEKEIERMMNELQENENNDDQYNQNNATLTQPQVD